MLRRFGEIPVASLYPILSFDDKMFLSPRGDKLQAAMEKGLKYRFNRFPSPRGDKLQPGPDDGRHQGGAVSVPLRG